jgi:hypothetical protein
MIALPFLATPLKPADTIDRVASLRAARSVHTVTALSSGQVLVVGGMASGGGHLASAELFDPATNRVETVASMATTRSGHTATLLSDGRVLIVGGYNGEYVNSVEVYNPAARRFTRTGDLVEGRSGHTATLLANGRVLITGGVGRGWTFLSSAELYDPATGTSAPTRSMASPRESHTATLLADGNVLIIGGHNGRRQAMEVYASAELYDVAAARFEPAGPLITPRHKHDALRLTDGRVLVIGGADRTDRNYFNTSEIFNPRTRAFEPGPTMANSRYKIAGTSVLLANGDVLVTSGARAAEVLDVRVMRFREVAGRLSDAYHFAAATSVPNGDVVITGGYAGSVDATDGVWRFRR